MIHLVGPGGIGAGGDEFDADALEGEGREPGAPDRIEHVHEELGDPGAVEEIHDYLVYEWDLEGGTMVARAHTDEMHTVSIMTEGPGGLQAEVPAPVEGWLRARFDAVRALDGAMYAPLRRSA